MTELVDYEKRGTAGVVFLDNPPVNALSAAVRKGIVDGLEQGVRDPEIGALVLIGRGRCFSGGADIREFGQPAMTHAPHLREVIRTIEDCPKPVVAAIHGTAVGGGLELALGCPWRIGDQTARLGLPEIKLGLIPGAGGTQRLPRVIGAEPALEMILSGGYIDAFKAMDLTDLLNRLVLHKDFHEAYYGSATELEREDLLARAADFPKVDLLGSAVAFAQEIADDLEGHATSKTRDRDYMEAPPAAFYEQARKDIARKARGLIAPYRCIDSVENAITLPFEEGMAKEREYFLECLESEQSKGQRHAFFAERQANKIPDLPADTPARPIESAAVVGAGTMGGGIAMNFASAGRPVTLLEASQEALDKGLAIIAKNYAGSVSRGRMTQEQMDTRMGLIRGTTDPADLAQADIVIEAVFEEMDIKKQVFATLDDVCKPEAILATNTSTLDVDEIAAATSRPEKVIGTHFFSPANVMRLMENVRGAKTSKQTIATVMKLSKTIGKVGVLVGICDGFVGNRMLYAYSRQSNFLVEEGALPQQVDKVIYDFGFPMGPFAMGDLAGLDVGWRIRQRRAKTRPKDQRYSPIADRICELGRFGQKTDAGWYRYQAGSRAPIPDPEIEQLIVQVSKELGFERREIGDREILQRCIYPLINEGAKILEEGIAVRSSDIDVIWIYGYGFPVYRGGPMFYADQVGAKAIYEVMSRLYDEHGEMLKPAPLLAELAKTGKTFAEL